MANNEKIKKIIKDIRESGYPLEIEISSILRKDGWFVVNQYPCIDQKTKDVRVTDIMAMKTWLSGARASGLRLIIECKKSNKPWVFYTSSKESDLWTSLISAVDAIKKSLYFPKSLEMLTPEQQAVTLSSHIEKSHLMNLSIKVGTICHVPFRRKKDDKDDFFKATNQVLSALEYEREKLKLITYPVIVFDGEMYEFDIKQQEIEIKPIGYLQFITVERAEYPAPCIVDVMRKTHFHEFLRLVNTEMEHIVK